MTENYHYTRFRRNVYDEENLLNRTRMQDRLHVRKSTTKFALQTKVGNDPELSLTTPVNKRPQ